MEKETANSETYAYLFCDSKFKSASSVEGHITRKHRDQMKDGEPEEEEADDDLDENYEARMELDIEMRNQEGVVDTTTSEEEVGDQPQKFKLQMCECHQTINFFTAL